MAAEDVACVCAANIDKQRKRKSNRRMSSSLAPKSQLLPGVQPEHLTDEASTNGPKKRTPKKRSESILQNKIDQSLEKIKKRIKVDQEKEEKPQQRKSEISRPTSFDENLVLQTVLPFWNDDQRAVPNSFIRSGLFSAGSSIERERLSNQVIASLSNYKITYTGDELQQDDLSVWACLMHMGKSQPIGDEIRFTGYQIIKDLKWRMHSDSYKKVKACIERMKVTGLRISEGDEANAYTGSLIRDYSWSEMDGEGNARWMVRFEPRVGMLMGLDNSTLMSWKMHRLIGTRSVVASWLFSFYSSHREPFPISVGRLYELSRSRDKLSGFKRTLERALEKLVSIGFLTSFSIKDDMVSVKRAALKVQYNDS